jgi:hypothetical protein
VQEPDVEEPADRLGVGGAQIFAHRGGREALAVHRQAQLLEHMAGRTLGGELDAMIAQRKVASDLALRVVVAADPHDARAGLAQSGHLRGEEQAGRVVAPVTVVEIPGHEQQPRVLLQAQIDQVLERASRGTAHLRDGRSLVARESDQRAVEVQIGGVHDGEAHFTRSLPTQTIRHNAT